jgi:hypothetical protein
LPDRRFEKSPPSDFSELVDFSRNNKKKSLASDFL